MCDSTTSKLASSTNVEVIKASYTWTIRNFSCLSQRVYSSIFSMGDNNEFEWRLRLYPVGMDRSSKNHISLYLEKISSTKSKIIVNFDFSIIKADGSKHILASHKKRSHALWISLGQPKLIERIQLLDKRSGFLEHDRLRIVCEVRIGTGNVLSQPTSEEPEPMRSEAELGREMGSLLRSKAHADVTLLAGGARFEVHRAILSARSPVFAAMFEHDTKEQQQREVEILDIDKEVLEQLLCFLYTGRVEKLGPVVDRLLVVAHQHALEDLKLTCERWMVKNLTIANVFDTLSLAHRYKAVALQEHVINFAKVNGVQRDDYFESQKPNSDNDHTQTDIATSTSLYFLNRR